MTKGYEQIVEDEWIAPQRKGFIDQCCDCGLVHIISFAVVDKRTRKDVPYVEVQFKLKVDRRKTAASRRKLKFSKEKD
jgi:hypothetical protein